MPIFITHETFDSLTTLWTHSSGRLHWNCLFVLPCWLESWWIGQGNTVSPTLPVIWKDRAPIGVAPLYIDGERAGFLGSPDVCDYQDFVITPGFEQEFFSELIAYLKKSGVRNMVLNDVRYDSSVLTGLVPIAEKLSYKLTCEPSDVVYEMALPGSWDAYLTHLNSKQRHEIRRKLRRLHEAQNVTYRIIEEAASVRLEIDNFLHLFRSNRSEKANFMTQKMESFFRIIVDKMAHAGLLKFGFMDLDGVPAAAVMFFDHDSTRFLYNNGYDSRFQSLNVGLLSKVFSIEDAIGNGLKRYSFLKGSEVYKQRLGGTAIPLYSCILDLKT